MIRWPANLAFRAPCILWLVVLRVEHPGFVSGIDSLERQGGDKGGANAATVFGGKNFDGVLLTGVLLFGPVEDLFQGLGTPCLEMGVLVKDGSVGADMAPLIALLLADGSHSASRKPRSSCADKLSQPLDHHKLAWLGNNTQFLLQ
jgi:hypothetical protein